MIRSHLLSEEEPCSKFHNLAPCTYLVHTFTFRQGKNRRRARSLPPDNGAVHGVKIEQKPTENLDRWHSTDQCRLDATVTGEYTMLSAHRRQCQFVDEPRSQEYNRTSVLPIPTSSCCSITTRVPLRALQPQGKGKRETVQ